MPRQTKLDRQLIEDLSPFIAPNRRPTAAEQKRRWREQYEQAVDNRFQVCIGQKPGKNEAEWIELSPLRWARQNGVPSKLVQTWEAARQDVAKNATGSRSERRK